MPSPMTELKELVETKFDFLRNMGLKVLILEPGKVRLILSMKGNENHLGILWAGVLFSLAEVPGGILAYSTFDMGKVYLVVKEMNIKFLKPGNTDATIEMSLDRSGPAGILRAEHRSDPVGPGLFPGRDKNKII